MFEGVSQWLNDGIHLCVDVGVVQSTGHNLHRTNHIEISIYRTHLVLTIGGLFSLTLRVCDSFLPVKIGFTLASILASRE